MSRSQRLEQRFRLTGAKWPFASALTSVACALALCCLSRGAHAQNIALSAPKPPRATVEAVILAYNKHDAEAFLVLHSPDMLTVSPSMEAPVKGVEALRTALPQEWRAFPDSHIETRTLIGDGDTVAVESVWMGTYLNSLPGYPPARGQKVRLNQMAVYTLKDDKIIALRSYYNPAELVRQLQKASGLSAPKASTPVVAKPVSVVPTAVSPLRQTPRRPAVRRTAARKPVARRMARPRPRVRVRSLNRR